jgi:hypothetical protein
MPPKIFISYRRDDNAGQVGRIHDRLQQEFGGDCLFMDVDSVPLGVNFVKLLGEEIAKCDALLAIIGPSWLDARDEMGDRRLENPDDFVRLEISTALKRDIPVIPILLEDTPVPKADQLPGDLKELAQRNGLNVRHTSFRDDMERLIRGLKAEQSPQMAASAASSDYRDAPSHLDAHRSPGKIANRAVLGWVGGGLAAIAAALSAAFYFVPSPQPAPPAPALSPSVSANCGGIAVGGNVSGTTITAGSVTSADCAPKSK